MNYYIATKTHISDLNEQEYKEEFGKIFKRQAFKAPYKQMLLNAKSLALKQRSFVAIHMRVGDVVEEFGFRRSIDLVFLKYIFPVDYVIYTIKHFIYKERVKVILFSSDKHAAKIISNFSTFAYFATFLG
ncbi:TPA: hypothetical protein RTG37_000579 [Campylobacter jejuni]|nr:hypothetical protein [Campylobacter jejuni]